MNILTPAKVVKSSSQMPAAASRKAPSAVRQGKEERRGIEASGLSVEKAQKFYDTDGAAKYLDCSPGHVRKLVEQEKLKPRKKKGKGLSFTQAALDRFLKIRRGVGRPVGSGKIKRSEEERRYWREYMRKRRKKGAKKAAGKSRASARPTSKKVSRKEVTRKPAGGRGPAIKKSSSRN